MVALTRANLTQMVALELIQLRCGEHWAQCMVRVRVRVRAQMCGTLGTVYGACFRLTRLVKVGLLRLLRSLGLFSLLGLFGLLRLG